MGKMRVRCASAIQGRSDGRGVSVYDGSNGSSEAVVKLEAISAMMLRIVVPRESCVACRREEIEVCDFICLTGMGERRIVNQGFRVKMELTAHPAATVRPVLGLSH